MALAMPDPIQHHPHKYDDGTEDAKRSSISGASLYSGVSGIGTVENIRSIEICEPEREPHEKAFRGQAVMQSRRVIEEKANMTEHELTFIIVVIMAQLFTQMNLGNTIIQLKQVGQALGVGDSTTEGSWFVASYSMTVGAFVLATGRLGDIYGFKTLWIIGWIWTAAFSLICGFCGYMHSPIAYDIFRALTGIGPSILMPNAAALIGTAFNPGFKKNLAFALFGAVAPGGYVLGLLWGALFAQLVDDWRWTYWAMCLVCLVLAGIAYVVIPTEFNKKGHGTFDYLGTVVGVSGLVLVFFSFNGAPSFNWSTPYIPVLLAVGLLLLAAFVYIENHTDHPVMPMSLFLNPVFSAVIISLMCGWMSFGMYQYYTPNFLLHTRSLTQINVAAQFIPSAISGGLAALIAVYLLPRVSAWPLFLASMVFFCAGQVLLALTPVDQTYWAMTFPTIVLTSLGPDLSFASGSLIVSDASPRDKQGIAGSFVNTVVNYSIGLGLAFGGSVEKATNLGGKDVVRGYRGAWWLGTGFAGLGIVVTVLFRKRMEKSHKA
ncbi:MAG: hypothetical protein M1834_006203 [Cirrosporium novae-zelandiae]|nr:MAG: hypothetical protein M1834_006203 [Cirrosporium novae-zelandiae]